MAHRSGPRCSLSTAILLATAVSGQAMDPSASAGRTAAGDTARFLTWTYKDAPMGLHLPAPTGKPMPVLMFLHGCNNDPVYSTHWIIAAANAIEPTAVFLPTAPVTPNTQYPCADWGGTYDAKIRSQMQNALHELDSLIKLHGLDTTRQYLYGESMGGEGVYRLLMDFPTRFAGAVDVAGYTPRKGAAQMANTPLWIWIGTEDEMSPIADARAIHEAIVQAGGKLVKFTEVPELGHVPAIELARTDTSLLAWLFDQVRTPALGRSRSLPSGQDRIVAFANGSLRLSESLPSGTRISLLGLDGTVLFETDAGRRSVLLPASLRDRVVFWKASHPGSTLSGKAMFVP